MSHSFFKPEKSFFQRKFQIHIQIISFSCKERVGFLNQSKNKIPGHVVRVLFTFASKNDVLPMCHSLFYFNFKVLCLRQYTRTFATRAVTRGSFALSSTPIAGNLHLQIKANTHVHILHNATSSITMLADL